MFLIKNSALAGVKGYIKNAVDSVLLRYPTLNQVTQVFFFSNAINTRTSGIDLVLNGFYPFLRSILRYTLARRSFSPGGPKTKKGQYRNTALV